MHTMFKAAMTMFLCILCWFLLFSVHLQLFIFGFGMSCKGSESSIHVLDKVSVMMDLLDALWKCACIRHYINLIQICMLGLRTLSFMWNNLVCAEMQFGESRISRSTGTMLANLRQTSLFRGGSHESLLKTNETPCVESNSISVVDCSKSWRTERT